MGQAEKRTTKRWQQAVIDGTFDADQCAREIVSTAKAGDDLRLRDRSARLMRDFLMASKLRGMSGAGRTIRTKTRRGFAFLIAQATALLVYSGIVLLSMLFLRIRGVGFDGFFDAIIDFFRFLMPGND